MAKKTKKAIRRYSIDGSTETYSLTRLMADNDKGTFPKKVQEEIKALKKGDYCTIGHSVITRRI